MDIDTYKKIDAATKVLGWMEVWPPRDGSPVTRLLPKRETVRLGYMDSIMLPGSLTESFFVGEFTRWLLEKGCAIEHTPDGGTMVWGPLRGKSLRTPLLEAKEPLVIALAWAIELLDAGGQAK